MKRIKKGGKPKGYVFRPIKPEEIDMIAKYAAAGLNNDQMAALLDISPSTFDRRLREDDKIRAAVDKGRSQAIYNVAASAYQQAISGDAPAMTMFYLKCRAGWKETNVNEVTGKDGERLFQAFTTMVKNVADGG